MLSEARGRYSCVVKWFIWFEDTWWNLKHYRSAVADLSPSPSPLPLCASLSCGLFCCRPVHIPFTRIPLHPVPQECVHLRTVRVWEGEGGMWGGPQALPLVTLLKCVLIYSCAAVSPCILTHTHTHTAAPPETWLINFAPVCQRLRGNTSEAHSSVWSGHADSSNGLIQTQTNSARLIRQ